MSKKIRNTICLSVSVAFLCIAVYFFTAFFGNPVSSTLARLSAERYLEEHFSETNFEVTKMGYDLKTGGYYAHVETPASMDRYFTVYFDALGRYRYDTYDAITSHSTTFGRINEQYWNLVKERLPYEQFDISIGFGELQIAGLYEIYTFTDSAGKVQSYTLDKDFGLDRSALVLDSEYDISQLGKDHGRITLYIHDPEVSVSRAAQLLLEIKAYMDAHQLPFRSIDFHLCEPRNEDGQNVGNQITLYEFLYEDIYEDGLVERILVHWNIAQEHHAIQDGLKQEAELLIPYFIDIAEDAS